MISDRYQNNLRFSNNDSKFNDDNGLLNQNPLIITKSEAFSFNYADPERLKYAQMLAKRDIKTLRSTESSKETAPKVIEPQGSTKKVRQCNVSQRKLIEDRVSSIKRVPGPQTPSRLTIEKKVRPSILRTTDMPARSMSPPVRDTDTSWRPKQDMERLQLQMNKCTDKLDQLERNLTTQSCARVPQIMAPVTRNISGQVRAPRDLRVLEDKLRSLLQGHSPRTMDVSELVHRTDPPKTTFYSDRSEATPRLALPIDQILNRLESLSTEMNTIRSRWTSLPYETVSVCGEDVQSRDLYRFTRQTDQSCVNLPQEREDTRLRLDVPTQLVMRLDGDRQRFTNATTFPRLSERQMAPTRAAEWFSEDIVNEVVDGVLGEIEEASGQLVDEILDEELRD